MSLVEPLAPKESKGAVAPAARPEASRVFEELDLLRKSLAIRDLLMMVVLEDRGVQALANRLSELIGNPVVVGNRFFRLIASAGPPDETDRLRRETVRARGTPREVYEREEFGELLERVTRSERPIYVEPRPELMMERGRIFTRVVAGRDLLGYVVVQEASRPLEPIDYATVEHAAVAFAIEIIKERSRVEAEHRVQGGFFSNTLLARDFDEEYATKQAAILGYDLASQHRIMIVKADEPDGAAPAKKRGPAQLFNLSLSRDLFDVVNGLVQRRNPGCITFMKNESLVLAIPSAPAGTQGAGGPDRRRCDDVAEAIRREIHWYWPEVTLSIGVSRPFTELRAARGAFLESCKAIDIRNALRRDDPAVFFEDLGAYGLLFQPDNQGELLEFARGKLGPIAQYDAAHKTSLLATLEAYLNALGNIRQTARTLFVHVHTLNYRLQRIEDLAGIDLKDPEDCFNLQLALKIHRVTSR